MLRVLLLEDERLVRDVVAEELRDAGFVVLEAGTGHQALCYCHSEGFDVLVTDIRVPEPDGWEVAERCRASKPSLSVIYMTGYSPQEPRMVPGSRLIRKPFRPSEIIQVLGELGHSASGR